MHRKIIPYIDDIEAVLNGEFRPPVTCEIDPSNRCQNRCNFCMYEDYRDENPVDLDFGLYLGLLADLRKMGVKSITFTGGGEPLMHPRIEEMILAAQDFELGMATNGLILGRIFNLFPHFKFIRVSLDAALWETYRAIKGTHFFGKVVDNIERAVKIENRPIIGLSFVICPENEKEIGLASDLADRLGVDYLQIKPAYQKYSTNYSVETGKQSFVLKRYAATRGIPCAAAHLVGIVGADANAYYCCQGRGNKGFVVGNLRDGSFSEIWRHRLEMHPICNVKTCRYMNYGKGYERYSRKSNIILRHKNFL